MRFQLARKESLSTALELLAVLSKGKATIAVRGTPIVSVDADSKTLVVDVGKVKDSGLRPLDLVRSGEGPLGALTGPARIANTLSEQGWRLTLSSEGVELLNMGKGVSRLTGRIGVKPLKTRKLLKALR